jgi:succinate dehydrogenase / fumarate reductase flavoprotein subunit
MNTQLDARVPAGALEEKWTKHRAESKLVNPSNKRKFDIIVVGSGLAGASAAASLAEMGYGVKCFCFQDSPRRAHSIAAQGGINAAKNYQNDGDSVYRLFYDTIKGGDFRSREANVYRLAEVSVNIIDQCVAQGVPFAREYGGLLANRSFGGAQVSRTFYARGQTGQQLLLGAYQALAHQIAIGGVQMFPRTELLDIVIVDGHAKGIVVRDLLSGEITSHAGDTVVLATGGYGNVFYLSTNARGCNVSATYRAYKRGAFFANPCYTQIHPTCIPVGGSYQSKLTLMSESLRNDGRVWVPKNKGDSRPPGQIPDSDRDYYLERKYPSFGNLAPRDIASRSAKEVCDEGRGVGPGGLGVYLDFAEAIGRLGEKTIRERYGNLFDIYHNITGEDAYRLPMRIYPAVHYTMGGLWVDYNLMSNIPGLHVLGEANFSDHGANRLGASALMQGLADGYFVIPSTIANYLATQLGKKVSVDRPEFKATEKEVRERVRKLLSIKGKRTATSFHRELGLLLWEKCGMARSRESLQEALQKIPSLREEFWQNLNLQGGDMELNQSLEQAGRVADFLEFAELMCLDALEREESCGGHFRLEHQTKEGEAVRNDEEFCHVAAWQYTGTDSKPVRNVEPLVFENVKLATRSNFAGLSDEASGVSDDGAKSENDILATQSAG